MSLLHRTHALFKRFTAILLSLVLLSVCALAEPAAKSTPSVTLSGDVSVFRQNGQITFVDGTVTDQPVRSAEEAAGLVEVLVPWLGGDSRTQFVPWRTLSDPAGNIYYVFQQMYGDTTVLGGAIKLITDASGAMLGLTASLVADLPDTATLEGITAAQAEQLVLEHEQKQTGAAPELLDNATVRIVLPVNRELDMEAEEDADA